MIYADLSDDERTRLRAAFANGFSLGSGCQWQPPDDAVLRALLTAIEDDYLASLELCDPPLMADNVPGWLLALPRQGKP